MVSLVLAVLVLQSATTAAVTAARRNCSDTCDGYDKIPYPFGLGSSCSLPGFSLTCVGNTSFYREGESIPLVVHHHAHGPGYPLLGNLPIKYFSKGDNYLSATISYSVRMIPGVRDYSVHWEAPARHFAVSGSSFMSLFIVGCGIKATLFVGNSTVEVGSCSVTCVEAKIMEKLPEEVCDGIGCCFIDIQVNLRAFTLNISRTSDSARSKKVYAFISGDNNKYLLFRPIDALRSMLPEDLDPDATVEWAIPYQPNCKRAMEDRASYACVANRSKCQDSLIGGYFCVCKWGGNPYVHGECQKYQPPPPPPPPPAPPAGQL